MTSMIRKPFETISQWYQPRPKSIYHLNEGSMQDNKLLSFKGANLCEVFRMGMNVPPAFIISTDTSMMFDTRGTQELPEGLFEDVCNSILEIERKSNMQFGFQQEQTMAPLLLSIRLGAPIQSFDTSFDIEDKFQSEALNLLGAPESWYPLNANNPLTLNLG